MAGPQNRFRLKNIDNTGFGTNSSVEGGRLVNPDGSNNVRKRGLPIWERISFYHTLLRMKRSHFFISIMLFYTATNIFFRWYLLFSRRSQLVRYPSLRIGF